MLIYSNSRITEAKETVARTGAAVLYTEDLNDGQETLGVRISNPFMASSTV